MTKKTVIYDHSQIPDMMRDMNLSILLLQQIQKRALKKSEGDKQDQGKGDERGGKRIVLHPCWGLLWRVVFAQNNFPRWQIWIDMLLMYMRIWRITFVQDVHLALLERKIWRGIYQKYTVKVNQKNWCALTVRACLRDSLIFRGTLMMSTKKTSHSIAISVQRNLPSSKIWRDI